MLEWSGNCIKVNFRGLIDLCFIERNNSLLTSQIF